MTRLLRRREDRSAVHPYGGHDQWYIPVRVLSESGYSNGITDQLWRVRKSLEFAEPSICGIPCSVRGRPI